MSNLLVQVKQDTSFGWVAIDVVVSDFVSGEVGISLIEKKETT